MFDLPMNCDLDTTWMFSTNNTQEKSTQLRFTYWTTRGPATYVYKNVNQYGYATVTASELGLTTGNTRTVHVQANNVCGYGPSMNVTLYKPTLCQCGLGPGCTVGRIAYLPDEQNPESQNQNIEGISMFPNPTSDILNINLNPEILSSNPKVSIYNILGQQKRSINITESETSINVEDLQTGVYILKIDYNGISETRKILKQ